MTSHLVLVDTSAWVELFRGRPTLARDAVTELLREGRAAIAGPVLAEVLRGARDEAHERTLRRLVGSRPFLDTPSAAWERAGALGCRLRWRGVTLPPSDLFVAATAIHHGVPVLSADRHFTLVPGLKLHPPIP